MIPNLLQRIDFVLWRQIHLMPRFCVEYWQKQELKKIVTLAHQFTPFYRDKWKQCGIDSKSLFKDIDLEKFPVISKKTFREISPEKWIHEEWPSSWRYEWKHTSGSTGEPFRFPVSMDTNLTTRFGSKKYRLYYFVRYLLWIGVLSKTLRRIKIVKIAAENPRDDSLYVPISRMKLAPTDVFAELKKYKPQFIYGRVTTIVELARLAESKKISFSFSYAYVHGEALTMAQRKYIQGVFNCEAYNAYGLEEVGEIAVECRNHDGLHMHLESCIFEILDEYDKRVPDGTSGRIVITHFYNHIMPFIRYDTLDRGYIKREKCACGINTPRLFVEGREGTPLFLGNRRFLPVEIIVFMIQFEEVLRFQIIIVSDKKFEIRVISVTGGQDLKIRIFEKFIEVFGVSPDIKIVDNLPQMPSGKNYFILDQTKIVS